jgi:hypothetical protein
MPVNSCRSRQSLADGYKALNINNCHPPSAAGPDEIWPTALSQTAANRAGSSLLTADCPDQFWRRLHCPRPLLLLSLLIWRVRKVRRRNRISTKFSTNRVGLTSSSGGFWTGRSLKSVTKSARLFLLLELWASQNISLIAL